MTQENFTPGVNCNSPSDCILFDHCRRARRLEVGLIAYRQGFGDDLETTMNEPSCGHSEEIDIQSDINDELSKSRGMS